MPRSAHTHRSPTLRDRFQKRCRRLHYSLHTENAYWRWIVRFIRFHGTVHPRMLNAADVRAFLDHLATGLNVAPSTQNQALSALVFLYDQVLKRDLGPIGDIERSRRSRRLPVVLSTHEVRTLLAQMNGTNRLIAQLLYGAGLRLMEALRLRVKDVDAARSQIVVRGGPRSSRSRR